MKQEEHVITNYTSLMLKEQRRTANFVFFGCIAIGLIAFLKAIGW